MKKSNLVLATILSPLLPLSAAMGVSMSAQAETVRDCVMEGTVKRHQSDGDQVYVAFHSAEPAKEGAPCRLRKREKLRFKAPSGANLQDAEPGTRVKYRYTEDSEKGSTWKLQKASS